jgi:hypothetical protein
VQHEWLSTNPVWTLDAWLVARDPNGLRFTELVGVLDGVCDGLRDSGVYVPVAARERWAGMGVLTAARFVEWPEPIATVYGLVLDRFADCGRVLPLVAQRAAEWSVAPPLPQHAGAVQDLLRNLLAASAAVQPECVSPQAFVEAFGCDIAAPRLASPRDDDGECSAAAWVQGSSMDVALLLAALAALAARRPACLRAAVAVLQADGMRFVPVQGASQKLEAFVRERGRGSLLVRAEGDAEAAAFDGWFDAVWPVRDLREFAQRLLTAGLLEPFANPEPVTPTAATLLVTRLEALRDGHRYADLLQLADRLEKAAWSTTIPLRKRLAAQPMVPPALRHLGRYEEAIAAALAWRERVQASEFCTHDDCAEADLELAASYIDPMQWREALALLAGWVERIDSDPRLLRATLRVRLWNTAARTMSLLGLSGWDALFQRSLAVQRAEEPDSLSRTRNYFAAACLRDGRLDDAEALLAAAAANDPYAARHRADLARRRGQTWSAPAVDALTPDAGSANHALGLYWLATGRHARPAMDTAARFERAAQCFRADLDGVGLGNVLWILLHAAEFAAARVRRDATAAALAASELKDHVTQPGLASLNAWLRDVLPVDGGSDYEPLLERLPW